MANPCPFTAISFENYGCLILSQKEAVSPIFFIFFILIAFPKIFFSRVVVNRAKILLYLWENPSDDVLVSLSSDPTRKCHSSSIAYI